MVCMDATGEGPACPLYVRRPCSNKCENSFLKRKDYVAKFSMELLTGGCEFATCRERWFTTWVVNKLVRNRGCA
jgi:hypothetical protein